MSVPYEGIALAETASSGDGTLVSVPWYDRGFVTKLIVVQVSGALEGFDVEVFNSNVGGDSSSEPGEPTGDESLYKIMPDITVASSYDTAQMFDTSGYTHINNARTTATTKAARNVYVRITPAGTGDKDFDVIVGGHSPNM